MPGIKRLHEIGVQDNRVRYLSLAAQHGSMRAAADVLGIAPSSISRQIGQLEQDLKIDLIEKGSYKMQLTEAGRLLVEYNDTRVVEHHNLLTRLADLRSVRTSTVRIAVGEGLLTQEVTSQFAVICRQYADVTLDIVTASSSEIQRMVLNGAVELGLLFEVPGDVRLRVKAALAQPISLICKPDTRLASRASVTLADVADERLVLPGSDLRISEIVHSVFRDANLRLNTVIVCNTLRPLVDSVRTGIGVTLLPQIVVQRELLEGHLVAVRVECKEFQTTGIHVVSRIGHRLPPPALALLSGIASSLNSLATPG